MSVAVNVALRPLVPLGVGFLAGWPMQWNWLQSLTFAMSLSLLADWVILQVPGHRRMVILQSRAVSLALVAALAVIAYAAFFLLPRYAVEPFRFFDIGFGEAPELIPRPVSLFVAILPALPFAVRTFGIPLGWHRDEH